MYLKLYLLLYCCPYITSIIAMSEKKHRLSSDKNNNIPMRFMGLHRDEINNHNNNQCITFILLRVYITSETAAEQHQESR